MSKNTFCHVEFNCTDLDRAQRFYESMFDWKFQKFTDEMVVFGTGEQHLGGLMKVDRVEAGSSPSVWVEVDDVDAYCSRAGSAGGSVVSTKSEVPSVGWSAVVRDPDGNNVGLVQFAGK